MTGWFTKLGQETAVLKNSNHVIKYRFMVTRKKTNYAKIVNYNATQKTLSIFFLFSIQQTHFLCVVSSRESKAVQISCLIVTFLFAHMKLFKIQSGDL